MKLSWTLVIALIANQSVFAHSHAKRQYSTHDYYVLEHDPQQSSLDDVARSLGVEVVKQAGQLSNHWLVRVEKPAEGLVPRDTADPILERLESLRSRTSIPDSHHLARSADTLDTRGIASSVKYLSRQVPRQRVKRAPPPIRPPEEKETSEQVAERLGIKDPLFPDQWHLVNDEHPEHMMNVTGVWEMGITGKGVISAIVDDGVDYKSEDLAANFYAYGSYDFNDDNDLPTPAKFEDHHGTRCAGQIAAVRNTVCGVGVAYNSMIAGLRILSGPITDVEEAEALNYDFQNMSIYSCSWGPPDNGQAMEGPNYIIKKAVMTGINEGRGGKGSIFVFASGNGARHGDQCNFDGYTNSIYSVTVSAVDFMGLHPPYSEACAANMIVAYSSGSGRHIVTTDRYGKCSNHHGGTSAAAPNVVGVIALALEVRPDLTWRDVQHLCVETARMINPDDPDWEDTHVGRRYSYKYGFGAIDGYAYVTAAQKWKLVKPQAWLETPTIQLANGTMNKDGDMDGGEDIGPGGVRSTISISQDMLEQNNFEKLEHINVKVWISHTRRGDVEVEIVSPHGIRSVLGGSRKRDRADTGYPGWTFMTVKHWGEDPLGEWTIRVSDQESDSEEGSFLGWNMILWGECIDPSKAKKYEVPLVDTILPPPPPGQTPSTTTMPSPTTKMHSNPTAFLPGDHGSAKGEKHKPAFPSGSSTPTPDEGWFSDMSSLVSSRKWFFGAAASVAVFGLAAAIYFWRRRRARAQQSEYTTIPVGDDLPMSTISAREGRPTPGGPRTRELYDAFGEVSDDEDADEETGLRGGHPQGRSPGEVGFHSGFLDDDEVPHSSQPLSRYKDEPDEPEPARSSAAVADGPNPEDHPGSPASVSGDGSWEHATTT